MVPVIVDNLFSATFYHKKKEKCPEKSKKTVSMDQEPYQDYPQKNELEDSAHLPTVFLHLVPSLRQGQHGANQYDRHQGDLQRSTAFADHVHQTLPVWAEKHPENDQDMTDVYQKRFPAGDRHHRGNGVAPFFP
jgi:hypothetical protein